MRPTPPAVWGMACWAMTGRAMRQIEKMHEAAIKSLLTIERCIKGAIFPRQLRGSLGPTCSQCNPWRPSSFYLLATVAGGNKLDKFLVEVVHNACKFTTNALLLGLTTVPFP